MKDRSQQGMALVITLILISVITFLAITFLAVSRRERNAVTILTDQTTARLAADAAVERAKAELIVPMLANTNSQLSALLVSTTYFNRPGFASGVADITNVNYNHMLNGSPVLSQDDFRQNIANLLYSPRVPVFVSTNTDKSKPLDFRFYLDLNRNKRFDTNGFLPVIDNLGQTNGATNFVGDPEWIGILEKPDQPHSSTNRFVARYAFVAIPAGKTLDVNYIHNQAYRRSLNAASDGFLRNQGVGTWEINLAAFLADLNTNYWTSYNYRTPLVPPFFNSGLAFQDAQALLRHRYANNYNLLAQARELFPNLAAALRFDNIDQYSDGPLMDSVTNINESANPDAVDQPWAGADNTNHFFSTQDFLDTAKTQIGVILPALGFTDRLQRAGDGISSYNRYTYYRMLSQLGTDSAPEKDKININYTNGVVYRDANYGLPTGMEIIPNLVTNLGQWSPTQFFTMAADKLLRTYTTNWFNTAPADYLHTFFNINTNGLTNLVDVFSVAREYGLTNNSGGVVVPGFGITNIPVWVSNKFVYTPSVHRLLQLAANIYDATTVSNSTGLAPQYPYLPHVFRPLFKRETTNGYINVYVTGYEEVKGVAAGNAVLDVPVEARTLAEPVLGSGYSTGSSDGLITPTPNVYNVPWVIGAKEGFPNFNEYAMQNLITVSRRLEFRHLNYISGNPDDPNNPVAYTNQLYSVGVTNMFGIEAWNSYTNSFPRSLQMSARNDLTIVFYGTNSLGQEIILGSNLLSAVLSTNILPNTWTGITNDSDGNFRPQNQFASLVVPLETNFAFIRTNIGMLQSSKGFDTAVGVGGILGNFPMVGGFPIPSWWVRLTSRVRYILFDNSAGAGALRVVDYVSLSRDEDPVDVTYRLAGQVAVGNVLDHSENSGWYTNRMGGFPSSPTVGVWNQILASFGQIPVDWNPDTSDVAAGRDKEKAIQFFKINFGQLPPSGDLQKTNVFFAPYVPSRTIYQHVSWQANDPLVHYTVPDLTDPALNAVNYAAKNPPLENLRAVNDRYQPWGAGKKGDTMTAQPSDSSPANKDPLVYQSDSWDFPTNKFPNVGWLGRVHRGTPWQTIYMKSFDVDTNLDNIFWRKWSGDMDPGDSVRTRPVEDRKLFDLFTTAINDNATRGQLSINQSGLAAWSAVLSGVITLTNSGAAPVKGDPVVLSPWVIEPAGLGGDDAPVGRIVRAINDVRATNTLLFPDHSFHHVGDVLAVPELTVGSPFLNQSEEDMRLHGISEATYERIPQQIMSLLRLDDAPRFVIYAYGQALSPAPRSIITSGSYFGMSTNYQVTAETAVRAVVRVDGAPVAGTTGIATPHLVVESFNVLGPD